jgi:hypothetical protein
MEETPETKKEQTVLINGEEHKVSDLSQEQVYMLNQILDLENKIKQVTFNLDQLNASRGSFLSQLNASFENKEEQEAVNED